MSISNRPIELELLEGDVTDEEVVSFEEEAQSKEKSDINISSIVKTLYGFSKRQDKTEAAAEAIMFLGEKAGVPFDVPIPIGYGFIATINKSEGVSDILYEKDSNNTEMLNALQWLLEDGVCFKASLAWGVSDLMKVFITINKNSIQLIRQLPETVGFLEGAASTTDKIVSKTNVTKIALKLLFKLLKKDFAEYEDMSCFYSCIPEVVQRKIERKSLDDNNGKTLLIPKELLEVKGLKVIEAFAEENQNNSGISEVTEFSEITEDEEKLFEKKEGDKSDTVLEVGEDLDDEDD